MFRFDNYPAPNPPLLWGRAAVGLPTAFSIVTDRDHSPLLSREFASFPLCLSFGI